MKELHQLQIKIHFLRERRIKSFCFRYLQ